MVKLNNDWDNIIGNEFNKEYYLKLRMFLKEEYANSITKKYYDDMKKIGYSNKDILNYIKKGNE